MNWCRRIEKAVPAASVVDGVSGAGLLGACAQPRNPVANQPTLRSTIAFVSTRHDPAADPAVNIERALLATEIYLMNADGKNPRRLTENTYARRSGRPPGYQTAGALFSRAEGAGLTSRSA